MVDAVCGLGLGWGVLVWCVLGGLLGGGWVCRVGGLCPPWACWSTCRCGGVCRATRDGGDAAELLVAPLGVRGLAGVPRGPREGQG